MKQRLVVVADAHPYHEPLERTNVLTRAQLEEALTAGWCISGSDIRDYDLVVSGKHGPTYVRCVALVLVEHTSGKAKDLPFLSGVV